MCLEGQKGSGSILGTFGGGWQALAGGGDGDRCGCVAMKKLDIVGPSRPRQDWQ